MSDEPAFYIVQYSVPYEGEISTICDTLDEVREYIKTHQGLTYSWDDFTVLACIRHEDVFEIMKEAES